MSAGHVETVKVCVVDRSRKSSEGSVRIERWDKQTRMRRALKTLGKCWAGAVVAVLLPIIHWILVPGLFLAGIFLSLRVSSQESVVQGGAATCPTCGAPLEIVRGPDHWPLSDMCAQCQSMVTVEKMPSDAAETPAHH